MSMNVKDFLDYVNQTFAENTSSFSLMKRKIELGFDARIKEKDEKKFFPVFPGDGDFVSTRQEASEWIDENGGKSSRFNPYPSLRITNYGGTSLTHVTGEDKTFTLTGFQGPVASDPTAKWRYYPSFELMMGSLSEMESKWGYDVEGKKFTEEMYGKDLWIVFGKKPDLSFEKDNPETHNDYNCYTVVVDDKEEKRASGIDYVLEVFNSKDEAVAWMNENGHEVKGDEAGDAVDESSGIEMPESFANEEAWNTDGNAEASWAEIRTDLVNDLTPIFEMAKPAQVKALQKVSETWSISVPTLKEILTQLSPF